MANLRLLLVGVFEVDFTILQIKLEAYRLIQNMHFESERNKLISVGLTF